ncbi:MAG TPA: hypothetical protein VNH64_05055, partial [Parvularculaceae bacterium]|nr:hypothetical protein [Parvularculaceae bacterium]
MMRDDPPDDERGGSRQLALGLANPKPRYRRGDFCLAGSNEAAARTVFDFPASADLALAICGPAGSGKSHLAEILAAAAGVERRVGGDLGPLVDDVRPLVVIDEAERIADPK